MCASALGESEGEKYLAAIKKLIRWKLKAAQWQLDTVSTTSQIRKQNKAVNPTSFDQNPLKSQSQIKSKLLYPIMTRILCMNCTHDDNPEMSSGSSSHPTDTSVYETDTTTNNSSSNHLNSTTLVSGSIINNTVNKINKGDIYTTMKIHTNENVISYTESGQNIFGNTETGININKELYTHLNNSYMLSSPANMSSTAELVSSSTEHKSSSIHSMLNSTESIYSSILETHSDFHADKLTAETIHKYNDSLKVTYHTSIINESITEETKYMVSAVSEATKEKLAHANNVFDNRELLHVISDYDEDAINGSFTVLSNERSKREVQRIFNKVSYYF